MTHGCDSHMLSRATVPVINGVQCKVEMFNIYKKRNNQIDISQSLLECHSNHFINKKIYFAALPVVD